MKRIACITTFLLLAIGSGGIHAQDEPVFIALEPGAQSVGISGNGFTVVGGFRDERSGFVRTPATGLVEIGAISAAAVSRDGRHVVGREDDENGIRNAAIWLGGDEWRLLGSFATDAQPCDRLLSRAWGVSDDGSVVVGLAWDGCRIARAFRWDESGGMVNLGTVGGGAISRANGVSGDGRVVVGWSTNEAGRRQGAKWVEGVGELILGETGPVGEARATNSDGSIIVGQGCNREGLAWIWTTEAGLQCTGVDPGELAFQGVQSLSAVSEDGRVAGGAFFVGARNDAVIWIDGRPEFLSEYLMRFGLDPFRDWINTGVITGVSADGKVVTGWGAGPENFQGYIIHLPD